MQRHICDLNYRSYNKTRMQRNRNFRSEKRQMKGIDMKRAGFAVRSFLIYFLSPQFLGAGTGGIGLRDGSCFMTSWIAAFNCWSSPFHSLIGSLST